MSIVKPIYNDVLFVRLEEDPRRDPAGSGHHSSVFLWQTGQLLSFVLPLRKALFAFV